MRTIGPRHARFVAAQPWIRAAGLCLLVSGCVPAASRVHALPSPSDVPATQQQVTVPAPTVTTAGPAAVTATSLVPVSPGSEGWPPAGTLVGIGEEQGDGPRVVALPPVGSSGRERTTALACTLVASGGGRVACAGPGRITVQRVVDGLQVARVPTDGTPIALHMSPTGRSIAVRLPLATAPTDRPAARTLLFDLDDGHAADLREFTLVTAAGVRSLDDFDVTSLAFLLDGRFVVALVSRGSGAARSLIATGDLQTETLVAGRERSEVIAALTVDDTGGEATYAVARDGGAAIVVATGGAERLVATVAAPVEGLLRVDASTLLVTTVSSKGTELVSLSTDGAGQRLLARNVRSPALL